MVNMSVGVLDKASMRFIPWPNLIPNVVLIGSQKCGTTSLAHYLSGHPDIHVTCPQKEPAYYIFKEWAREYWRSRVKKIKSRRDSILNQMLLGYAGQKWIMDGSTHYTIGTRVVDFKIPERMKEEGVERLVYVVRNPYARMISNYRHVKSRVECDFNTLIQTDGSLVQTSSYAYQLEPYIRCFGAERVKLLVFEEFVRNPQATLNKVCDFLELPRFTYDGNFEAKNASTYRERINFDPEVFASVEERVSREVRAFEELLGRTTGWDLSRETWCGLKEAQGEE